MKQGYLSGRYDFGDDVQSASGKKHDTGKADVGQMFEDFPRALLGVAEVTRYGIEKYGEPGSWKRVDQALKRYKSAHGRHTLESNIRSYDEESNLLMWLHTAWNALAIAEFMLNAGVKVRKGKGEPSESGL